ncbi:hypothetical protein [Sorangium sp. So ce145]|uniref:hypothetical protein n=1 Tax=Sorangium sp. So ce145 TaxID=3133285 RepID=UPI003F616932
MLLSQVSSRRAASSRIASRSTALAPSRRRTRVSRVRGSSEMTTLRPREVRSNGPAAKPEAVPAPQAGAVGTL